ncbi:hypothetical protein [Draconibacterium sediminis]|nr:hypothetical protein [Draconibacterium sediminis]
MRKRYDLSKDRGEQHNVASKHPEVLVRIQTVVNSECMDSEYFKH